MFKISSLVQSLHQQGKTKKKGIGFNMALVFVVELSDILRLRIREQGCNLVATITLAKAKLWGDWCPWASAKK